ncbi:MFS siderophore iron transporter [Penicillium chermesinum]|uniref:MFS siderophore iron transporter n=1 Tax=Penicillium chermesinum TaxID=63820 RepID=A0A9W9NIG1_9EURO|nr:MFS siderophore iron transporter [Penicillium chermesinum]KAJ5220436.1 MFS siderophore iron transporter [Penicillium chermesinum]KAJ6157873.1 MFS siderophore iron transporter [Penicillium chermesinum]
MAVASKIRSAFRRQNTDESATSVNMATTEEPKGEVPVDVSAAEKNVNDGETAPEIPAISDDLQQGVRDVAAITRTWSKWSLAGVFINIWLLYFVNAFQSNVVNNLIPYLTSDWQSHSLLTSIYVVSGAITAACYIPIGKIMDVWGRAEGFLLMTIVATMGLVMMAATHNLATFCAGYVFYSLGFGGMTYCVDLLTADASQLKDRGLAYAFTSSPYVITAFGGSKASNEILNGMGMRWGIGIFAIIFPIVASPLYCILKYNLHLAKKQGLLARQKSNRAVFQSIWFYTVEFDALGVLLFSAGLVVFFLAFDIAGSAPDTWGTPYIIAMLVVGFVMLFFFVAYEYFFAPKPLFGQAYLWNRTVIGACALDFTYQLCYYCWNYYFTSFLQVVNDLTVAEAGYVSSTFDIVSSVLLIAVGLLIRYTGRFKWLLWIGVPLYIFAQGLMIYFRRPNQSVGYLIMCQVFISIGGSVFIICEQLAILAAVDQQYFAMALGLLNSVGTVGDAVGATISGVIWQNTFPKALKMYLPASAMAAFDDIYEDLDTQLKYPVGSRTRVAIQQAYAYAQTRMLAVGTGVMVLCFVWVLMIKNFNLKDKPQVGGIVF